MVRTFWFWVVGLLLAGLLIGCGGEKEKQVIQPDELWAQQYAIATNEARRTHPGAVLAYVRDDNNTRWQKMEFFFIVPGYRHIQLSMQGTTLQHKGFVTAPSQEGEYAKKYHSFYDELYAQRSEHDIMMIGSKAVIAQLATLYPQCSNIRVLLETTKQPLHWQAELTGCGYQRVLIGRKRNKSIEYQLMVDAVSGEVREP